MQCDILFLMNLSSRQDLSCIVCGFKFWTCNKQRVFQSSALDVWSNAMLPVGYKISLEIKSEKHPPVAYVKQA